MSFLSRKLDANLISSTGPITNVGKAISSQNARKHGLNAPPDGALVSLWFNVILNNCGDEHEEPSAADPRREAALRLAIAEVRYHRALHKVDTHESEPGSAQQLAMKLAGSRKLKQWESAMTPTDFNPHSRKHRKLVKTYQPSAITTD